MRTAPTAIGVYVNPTMKVFSVDSVKKDITASLFAKVSIPKQVMFPQCVSTFAISRLSLKPTIN